MIPKPLALLLVLLLLAPTVVSAAEDVDRIVLRVNDQILTLYEYEQKRDAFVEAVLASSDLTPEARQERLSELGRQVVWDAYREMLLLSRAKQLGVEPDDEQVEAAIADVRQRQGITTEAQLQQALAASGMTLDELKDNIRREIRWSQVVGQEVTSTIQIADEELRAHYRTHREDFTIAERRRIEEIIVLETAVADPDERRELAEKLRADATAADGFGSLELPEASTSPIELGWLTEGELDPALADAAFSVEEGSLTEPVEGRGGLHVLHVLEVEEGRVRPFSEVENLIRGRERSLRFDRALREYVAGLEENAWIVEDLPPDAVGYRELAGSLERTRSALDIFRDPQASVPERVPEDVEEGSEDG